MNKFIFTTLLSIFIFSCDKNIETNSEIITRIKQNYFKDEGLEIAAMVFGDMWI